MSVRERRLRVAACPLPGGPRSGDADRNTRRSKGVRLTGIWYVVGFAFAGVSFVFLTIGAAWLVSHRNRGDVHKGLPYESGIDTYGDTHGRFGLSFYIYALLFVAFDIEVIFIYLWAIAFQRPAARRPGQHADLRRDPAARPRLRLAQGGADMAVTARPHGAASAGPDPTTTAIASDAPTSRRCPRRGRRTRLTVPIVVPNSLWQAADPEAYDGGRPTDITHLAEFEASGLGRRDDARWGGLLEVIPTKADYVLDLIRMNSLWPLLSGPRLLRDRDDVGGDLQERHGPLGHVPVPGQPAPGGRPDRGRHPDHEDGRPARPAVGADAGAEVVRRDGRLHLLGRPLQAELLDGRGHRPGHARRRLRPGLPAPPRGPHLRDDEAPAARQGPPRPLAGPGDRARPFPSRSDHGPRVQGPPGGRGSPTS